MIHGIEKSEERYENNDSTDDTMATDINPLKYIENQGKYMGIYLILNVSGQTDRLLGYILIKFSENLDNVTRNS